MHMCRPAERHVWHRRAAPARRRRRPVPASVRDARGGQLVQLGRGQVQQLRQHLAGVLSEHRRTGAPTRGAIAERDPDHPTLGSRRGPTEAWSSSGKKSLPRRASDA